MNSVLELGECVHIVEHRRFETDVRRHFVGRVEALSTAGIRVSGFMFVFDQRAGSFVRKEDHRTRIFQLDNLIGVTVLPAETNLDALTYQRDEGGLAITDGSNIRLDIAAFGSRG